MCTGITRNFAVLCAMQRVSVYVCVHVCVYVDIIWVFIFTSAISSTFASPFTAQEKNNNKKRRREGNNEKFREAKLKPQKASLYWIQFKEKNELKVFEIWRSFLFSSFLYSF